VTPIARELRVAVAGLLNRAADELDRCEWIRCDDEKPRRGERCLLYTTLDGGHVWIGCGGVLPPDVTHWMPLPPPPAA